jgi:hypothetical protein
MNIPPLPNGKEIIKKRIHNLTGTMTNILGYLELEEYEKVVKWVKEAVKELDQLAKAIEVHIIKH